jgi:site-specific DNA-methyltransferase (adenine-specific)
LLESWNVNATNAIDATSLHMIKPLTVEGMTVLDPFMGYGTTGLATVELNRKFIGIEIDQVYFMVVQAQLS